MVVSMEDSILWNIESGVGNIILNRPGKLNALNLEMVEKLSSLLKTWDKPDSGVLLVIIQGSEDRAFCSGGDVKALSTLSKGSKGQRDFLREEYKLDYLISNLTIPYISIMDGITMGGGAGISINGKWRVATEHTVFTMPEVAIGLVPDVGAGFFLTKLPGYLGEMVALTGHRIIGWDCLAIGLATHAIPKSKIPDLLTGLKELATNNTGSLETNINSLLDNLCTAEIKEHCFSLSDQMDTINKVFSSISIKEIIGKLKENNTEFVSKLLTSITSGSPTSLILTLHHLQRARSQRMDLAQSLVEEHRLLSKRMMDNDFYEGIRAVLVDKDNKPTWDPKDTADIKHTKVEWYFNPLDKDHELNLVDSHL